MKEITTPCGAKVLVDDEDYESLSSVKWLLDRKGYSIRHFNIRTKERGYEYMHRRIMGLERGDKRQVDHIDGNRKNNQRSNLRICTSLENNRNRRMVTNQKTGFKGVSVSGKKFQALIRIKGKHKYLGLFDTPEEAHEVYCLAADMVHGEFSNHG